MNYNETIEYLFNSTPVFEKIGAAAYKEGLENTLALDVHFHHPHRQFKTIHVAGTNGKGSVSHSLAAILQCAGYRVGLYTSPHLVDFRERIRVNGECISEQYVIDFVEEERAFFEPLHPSFFELTTALAFKYFAEQKVDIAVIEVGLGGRLDCTNIISPVLSVITNISLDHTQFLGDTLAKIAEEKAGIIKHETPVVIGESNDETRPVFEQKARQMNASIYLAHNEGEILSARLVHNGMSYRTRNYGTLRGELSGSYQKKNTETLFCALKQLIKNGMCIEREHIATGLAHVCELTGLMGRWQKVHERPTVICDTGHNAGGWQYLSRQLKAQKYRQLRIVFGMVDDKDLETVMRMLPKEAVFYFTKASTKRAVPETIIMQLGIKNGLKGQSFPTVNAAYEAALGDADPEDFIFVGGSSYVVADFLSS